MKKVDKGDSKFLKKVIVNGLTLSRVVGTVIMPLLFSSLSAPVFLGVVAMILFTDCLDGILARHWGVSTIFGSLADMTADKLFGVSVLIVLSTMYPIMAVPLALETIIAGVNVKSAENGTVAKSSEIGRIKTWVMGLSICSLLLVGLAPELSVCLENIKIDSSFINNIKNTVLDFVSKNKSTVESVAITSAITSESIVAVDYAIKSIKGKENNSEAIKWADLIKSKKFWKYVKKIALDEKYYKETRDMSLIDKLTTSEIKIEIKEKKLTLSDKK